MVRAISLFCCPTRTDCSFGCRGRRLSALPIDLTGTSQDKTDMDLGIAGRKAIVCASSRGLGLACATALAEAGCEVVINGRDRDRLAAAAAHLRQATGAKIVEVAADVASPDGQTGAVRRLPRTRTSSSTTMAGRRRAIFASSTGKR